MFLKALSKKTTLLIWSNRKEDDAMKRIVREVKDLNSFVVERKICFAISVVVGFFADYIPFVMGASTTLWLLLFVLFSIEAYFVCRILNAMRYSPNRLTKQHISDFLYVCGNNIVLTSKLKIAVVNPFVRRIYYITKTENTQTKVKDITLFVLLIKTNNYYSKKLYTLH